MTIKTNVIFFVSLVWTGYCIITILFTLNFSKSIYYNLGVATFPLMISLPVLLFGIILKKRETNKQTKLNQ